MQTITLRETVGEDGVLRLQVSAQPRGARVEVVVLQSETNGDGKSAAKRPSIMDFVGIITDEIFEIPEDLPLGDVLVIE